MRTRFVILCAATLLAVQACGGGGKAAFDRASHTTSGGSSKSQSPPDMSMGAAFKVDPNWSENAISEYLKGRVLGYLTPYLDANDPGYLVAAVTCSRPGSGYETSQGTPYNWSCIAPVNNASGTVAPLTAGFDINIDAAGTATVVQATIG
jgi:hypothetical protein